MKCIIQRLKIKQNWITNVLRDLGKFAKDDNIDALAARIKDAQFVEILKIESTQKNRLIDPEGKITLHEKSLSRLEAAQSSADLQCVCNI